MPKEISYLDATGTIIADWEGRRVLYYPLVIRHPVPGNPPLPVAELITNCHNVHIIQNFLRAFRRDEMEIYGSYASVRVPKLFTCDQGKAILIAALHEFNQENIQDFLGRVWTLLQKKDEKAAIGKMTPHICCSHFMRKAHNMLKILKKDKEIWYRFLMYIVALFVNAETMKQL